MGLFFVSDTSPRSSVNSIIPENTPSQCESCKDEISCLNGLAGLAGNAGTETNLYNLLSIIILLTDPVASHLSQLQINIVLLCNVVFVYRCYFSLLFFQNKHTFEWIDFEII